MGSTPARTPTQVLGSLLSRHPEAASLQAESSHARALARSSASAAAKALATQQAARLSYEELRHRVDPRGRRSVPWSAGAALVSVVAIGLTLLDLVELSGTMPQIEVLLVACAGAVAWLITSWTAAAAACEGRRPMLFATGALIVILATLLSALSGTINAPVLRISVGVFILALTTGTTVLMGRMESLALYAARRRLHRARASQAAAVGVELRDAENAAVTAESWIGLVRSSTAGLACSEEEVAEAVKMALALLEAGRTSSTADLPATVKYRPSSS